MKAILKTAMTEKQRYVANLVISRRSSNNDDDIFMILSTIMWQLGTAAQGSQDQVFFNSLYNSYVDYRLKQLKITLGDMLTNTPVDFDKMKETVNNFSKKIEANHKLGVVTEQPIAIIRKFISQALASIDRKQTKEGEQNVLSIPGTEDLSAPMLQWGKGSLFYLKDASAKKFLESKGATVTRDGENVVVKGKFDVESDIGFKLKATKL